MFTIAFEICVQNPMVLPFKKMNETSLANSLLGLIFTKRNYLNFVLNSFLFGLL